METSAADSAGEEGARLCVALLGVGEKDRALLVEELKQFGRILKESGNEQRYEVELLSGEDADDIEAVLCFVVEPEQLEICVLGIGASAVPAPVAAPAAPAAAPAAPPVAAAPAPVAAPAPAPRPPPSPPRRAPRASRRPVPNRAACVCR